MIDDKRIARQRGAGKLGGIISLALLFAFGYAIWNVAPVYMADYTLGDKMIEVCRLRQTDDDIRELLMRTVREEDLTQYINKADFKIQARDNKRRITVDYQREAKVLPGWVRIFKFSHDVDQPFF